MFKQVTKLHHRMTNLFIYPVANRQTNVQELIYLTGEVSTCIASLQLEMLYIPHLVHSTFFSYWLGHRRFPELIPGDELVPPKRPASSYMSNSDYRSGRKTKPRRISLAGFFTEHIHIETKQNYRT